MRWRAAIFALALLWPGAVELTRAWPVPHVLLFLQQTNFNAEGMKALDEQEYDQAAQAFQKAIEADPENYAAHFNLALANTMLGKTGEAIAGYEKVLELKPGLYEAELNLGILLLERKDAARALVHLKSALEKKPDEFRPNYYVAEALAAAGRYAEAEPYYKKAQEVNAGSAATQAGLARAMARQGRVEEAEAHYRRAAEIDPSYRSVLLELAALLEEKGRKQEAISIYEQFPENPVVRERLGNLLLETGHAAEAIPHLQFAVSRSPTAANRFALATAYLRTKQPEKAVPLLELALEEKPDNFDLRMMYGRILRDQRKYGPAAQQFLKAVQQKPNSQEAWNELAGMLILLENYPQALAALDRVEALGHAPPGIHYFRAIILDKAHMYKPALASYEKYLALADGSHPDEEFKARQRVKVIKKELSRR